MASIELRGQSYRIVYRYGGRKVQHPLKTDNESDARAALARLEENLRLLGRGRLQLPPDADLTTFILSDGRVSSKALPELPKVVTLGELAERYEEVHSNGAIEASSLETVQMHLRHFKKTLGVSTPLGQLQQEHLQQHLTKRAKQRGIRKRRVSAVTLRKEMATLRAAWTWAHRAGIISKPFPGAGLVYPKTEEKPPFQTWEQIERQIKVGGPDKAAQLDLWDCLFLTLPEIAQVLAYVKENAAYSFLHPMFAFAAYTGARRSEMMRLMIADLDLASRTAVLHEKKRAKGRRTSRHVPLCDCLAKTLQSWLTAHPGGPFLFRLPTDVVRSKKSREEGAGLTRNEANDHFKRTLCGSKWAKLRGWHVFRHSFASNCAAKGVDQRLIDGWLGHTTEEMRRRYRHLFPSHQQAAIQQVFGGEGKST